MKYIKEFEKIGYYDYAINKFFIENETTINFVIDIENISNKIKIIVFTFTFKEYCYILNPEYDIESFNKIKFMSEHDLFKYYPKLCAKLYLKIKSGKNSSTWHKKLYNMLNSIPELVEYSEIYKYVKKYNL